jgi:hypothetical protein
MSTWNVSKMWLMSLLLVVFVAGCGQERGTLPPTLTAINPNGGVQGQTLNVVILTGTNFATGATINVPGGAGITVTNTAVLNSTQMTATFAIAANAALGAVNISVTTSGVTTNTVTFTIRQPLAVTSTIPGNGAVGVPLTTTVSVTFNQAMNCSTLTPSTFAVTIADVAVAGTISSCAGSSATFTPTVKLAPNATYSATIATGALDSAGDGLAIPYVWSFSTVVLPQVISTVPLPGATGVPINQAISATFSEGMNPVTLNSPATNFTVMTTVGGVNVPGTVTYVAAGSTATFTPTAPLAATTQYTATITTGAQDPAGNGLLNPYIWMFTTGAAPDKTPPFIISTIPVDKAPAVPINQAVTATFNKAMNPVTLSSPATNFTLSGPSGPVAGIVTYAAIAKTATFTPNSPLASNAVYTATVTTGAQDLAGNALGPGPVPNPWTFTTAPVVDNDNPTIISTNPANASTGIALNATVNATFSEAMNPLTISTVTFLLTGPGGVVINGTVAYDSVNFIATFIPSSNLTANTTYTATVTTGAQDLSFNPLGPGLVPNPWTFKTAAVIVPSPVPLGTASTFGSFGGGAGITNQGTAVLPNGTVINGNIGTTGASTLITGFHDTSIPYLPPAGCIYTETPLNVGTVNGNIYTAPPPPTVTCPNEGTAVTFAVATQAALDALTAFNFTSPASMPCTAFCAFASELGGLTLAPGVYQSAAGSFAISGTDATHDLTLDAKGDPNAFWVFQSATTLTVGTAGPTGARSVILINGAQAKNVFWHVGSAATINGTGGGTMVGTIMAQAGVTFSTAGNVVLTVLNGRALVLTGPVTMVNTVINVPAP